jgi:hypothetical protein
MTEDGYPDQLTRASTRAWIFMLRVSKKRSPRRLLERKFVPWIDRNYRSACAVHIWRRWVVPPKQFEGQLDIWTHAKREYVGRFPLRRRRKSCPQNFKPAAKD